MKVTLENTQAHLRINAVKQDPEARNTKPHVEIFNHINNFPTDKVEISIQGQKYIKLVQDNQVFESESFSEASGLVNFNCNVIEQKTLSEKQSGVSIMIGNGANGNDNNSSDNITANNNHAYVGETKIKVKTNVKVKI